MILYSIEHAPDGDKYRLHEGMSEETVAALLSESGNAYEFTTKEAYQAFIASVPLPPGVR
jgi:hypothetical protein